MSTQREREDKAGNVFCIIMRGVWGGNFLDRREGNQSIMIN